MATSMTLGSRPFTKLGRPPSDGRPKANYWNVTVSGTLWVMLPEVALIVTFTVSGVPLGVVAAGEFEEPQPLTPNARQLMNPTNRNVLSSSERLRRPASANNARGHR